MNYALFALGLLILGVDVWQDAAAGLGIVQIVRNLVMLAALIGLIRGDRWAGFLLIATSVYSFIRRFGFLSPWLFDAPALDSLRLALQAGMDVSLRVALLAAGVQLLRRSR